MANVGRPTKYTPELAEEICSVISCSDVGIAKLCERHPHWPDRTNIRQWTIKYPEFRLQYVTAKASQVDWLVERAMEVATDGSQDTVIDDDGNRSCDTEWLGRCRLHVDTVKWLSAKLAPKIYGEVKTNISADDKKSLVEQLIDKL